ncbi:MAG TPA: FAD-dependent oxidoreductase [Acidobacteriaceae bacterium]|nr:FAD-dependent oxidoreductase [Acidobacteriaceae bacterium]
MLSGSRVHILGAGVIGLSLALELRRRGAEVTVLERGSAVSQASWAAAGMLAARDPFNPPQLAPLSALSARLYPAFLEELEELSGQPVPFQTERTLQTLADGSIVPLREHSIDPRQLALALVAAVQATGVRISQQYKATAAPSPFGNGQAPALTVHTTGAWAAAPEIFPRKGQMLRVRLPSGCTLREVHRSEHVYVVPRTAGPQTGTALIGATVEDAGFNTDTCDADLAALRRAGAALVPRLPELLDAKHTPIVEAWAGLRPATVDDLPLLGDVTGADPGPTRHLIAAGHFRNGILLAPATAVLLADIIQGRTPPIDLAPFSPARFTPAAVRIPPTGHL